MLLRQTQLKWFHFLQKVWAFLTHDGLPFPYARGVFVDSKKPESPIIFEAPEPEKLIFKLQSSRLSYSPKEHLSSKPSKVQAGDILALEKSSLLPITAPFDGLCTLSYSNFESSLHLSPFFPLRKATPLPPLKEASPSARSSWVQRVKDAGLVGLGGAGFPTSQKLSRPFSSFLVNAVECEPCSGSDAALLLSSLDELFEFVSVFQKVFGIQKIFWAIESQRKILKKALVSKVQTQSQQSVLEVPNLYPMGSELQLLSKAFGVRLKKGQSSLDVGVLCLNVGTLFAMMDAIFLGHRLHSRVVSIHEELEPIARTWAYIGTPLSQIFKKHTKTQGKKIVAGGLMMSGAVLEEDAPLASSMSQLGLFSNLQKKEEEPCIHCSKCSQVCPVGLLPQELFRYAKGEELLPLGKEYLHRNRLEDCLLCGACDFVCPSSIPLTSTFLTAQEQLKKEREEKTKSHHAKDRFEAKKIRLEDKANKRLK